MATVHTRDEDDGDIAFILDRRRKRKESGSVNILAWVTLWNLLGLLIALPAGVLCSQYAPVFRGMLMVVHPWSPQAQSLISVHLFAFGMASIVISTGIALLIWVSRK